VSAWSADTALGWRSVVFRAKLLESRMPLPRSLFRNDPPANNDLRVTGGAWPSDISGEIFVSAPHPDTFGGAHPFYGDGMTYRLSLQTGTFGATADAFAWRQKRIDTPSARLRSKVPGVFRSTMVGLHSPFGMTNAANTAPLPWGNRLFMTWDVGRPVEIDPHSLDYVADVGHRNDWHTFEAFPQPLLPMVRSTAHPMIDPDRDVMWTVNTHNAQLHVVRYRGEGSVDVWPIIDANIPQTLHSITQTRDWLIVADCAYKIEPQVLFGGKRTVPANHSGPVYLIRKDDLISTPPGQEVACKRFEIAPEVNHYYAVYDDSDGIRVLFEHTENADIAMTQDVGALDALGQPCDPLLRGLYGFPMSPDRTSLIEFNPETGTIRERAELRDPSRLWTRQLSALDYSTEGMSNPIARHSVYHGWRPEAITREMIELYGDRVDQSLWPHEETAPLLTTTSMPDLQVTSSYAFAMDDFPTSPIFVPRAPSSSAATSRYAGHKPGGHDGYVVVPVINDAGFRVELFDAANTGAGPIATLRAPGMHVPFVLHSAWMPEAVPTDKSIARLRFRDELDRVDELPDDLGAAAHAVAHELNNAIPM
jgi:all-trans-8'-apo-beta-carotenal 15,15'-oxygenase